MDQLIGLWWPYLALPCLLALGAAYLVGKLLSALNSRIPIFLKASIASLAPPFVLATYFLLWDQIDSARHHAEHGDAPEIMTPMLAALILGAPFYLALAVASSLLAVWTVYARK